MTNAKFHKLFGGPPRKPESELTRREMDIARSIQIVTEEIVLRLARTIKRTGYPLPLYGRWCCLELCCERSNPTGRPFKDIWIQPAAGDAGGALGAALAAWYEYKAMPRKPNGSDAMRGAYLGTKYADEAIKSYLDSVDARYKYLQDDSLMPRLVGILEAGKVVGWFSRTHGIRSACLGWAFHHW